eukprot:scaffold6120_cov109-Isochrysis_galbana.AAC.2
MEQSRRARVLHCSSQESGPAHRTPLAALAAPGARRRAAQQLRTAAATHPHPHSSHWEQGQGETNDGMVDMCSLHNRNPLAPR